MRTSIRHLQPRWSASSEGSSSRGTSIIRLVAAYSPPFATLRVLLAASLASADAKQFRFSCLNGISPENGGRRNSPRQEGEGHHPPCWSHSSQGCLIFASATTKSQSMPCPCAGPMLLKDSYFRRTHLTSQLSGCATYHICTVHVCFLRDIVPRYTIHVQYIIAWHSVACRLQAFPLNFSRMRISLHCCTMIFFGPIFLGTIVQYHRCSGSHSPRNLSYPPNLDYFRMASLRGKRSHRLWLKLLDMFIQLSRLLKYFTKSRQMCCYPHHMMTQHIDEI